MINEETKFLSEKWILNFFNLIKLDKYTNLKVTSF